MQLSFVTIVKTPQGRVPSSGTPRQGKQWGPTVASHTVVPFLPHLILDVGEDDMNMATAALAEKERRP